MSVPLFVAFARYSVFVALAFGISVSGQQSPTDIPTTQTPGAIEKPRVFITDSQSWEMSGSGGGANGAWGAQMHGGARPQTAEIIKTFGERCSEVVVNNKQDLADYIVVLDHEGGKGYLRHRNKVAVFEHVSGDVVVSHSTLSLGGSVEDACNGIVAHWAKHGSEILTAKLKAPTVPVVAASATASAPQQPAPTPQASIIFDSSPSGSDIEIDGTFVGNTPSTVTLAPGLHEITVRKKGYTPWTRKMNVTGGTIHLSPELDKAS